MRLVYVLMAVIQFSFAFHAMKTGRGCGWITLILVFPVIGCLAYYFLEVFPNSSEERILRRKMRTLAKSMSPDAELQQRARDLAINPSVENRCKLAEELVGRRMYDDALRLYESCLEGPYANDKVLLKRVEDTRAAMLCVAA
jgi:hypothetical protein